MKPVEALFITFRLNKTMMHDGNYKSKQMRSNDRLGLK